jgi:hypothetical protein
MHSGHQPGTHQLQCSCMHAVVRSVWGASIPAACRSIDAACDELERVGVAYPASAGDLQAGAAAAAAIGEEGRVVPRHAGNTPVGPGRLPQGPKPAGAQEQGA